MVKQKTSAHPFPWDAAMRFGLGHLRLPPSHFWAMTPVELAAAVQALGPAQFPTVSEAALQRLMRLFPDEDITKGETQ